MTGPGSPELHVRGGAGGVRVRVDDLEAAATALDVVAAELAAVVVRAGLVAAEPLLLVTGLVAPASLARVELLFGAALLGPAGAAAAAARLGLLAVRLRAAAAGYELTEARVVVLVGELERAGLVPALPWVVPWVVPEPGGAPAAVTDLAAAAVPGGGPAVARVLGTMGLVSPMLAERAEFEVAVSVPMPVRPSAGVAGVLDRVAAAGAVPGAVTVDEVRRPGARRAFVVAIPGTQDWSPVPAVDPLDATADVATLAGASTAIAAAVVRALEIAGARPGEPVLLAGHSLGGMVAAQLAADPVVRERFSVTCVVTAGSPVAHYRVPGAVAVLSLEHTDDVVPALDGADNPDRRTWVTVRRASGAPRSPAGAHGLDRYAATAAIVDVSPDPSLVAWRAALAPFVAGPGVTALQRVVVTRRAAAP